MKNREPGFQKSIPVPGLGSKILAPLLHASKNCNSGPNEKSRVGGDYF